MDTFKKILKIALFYVAIPFVSGLPILLVNLCGLDEGIVNIIGVPAFMLVIYLMLKKFTKLTQDDFKLGVYVNGGALLLLTVAFTILMVIAKGNTIGTLVTGFCFAVLQFAPSMILPSVMGQYEAIYITVFVAYLLGFVFCFVVAKCNFKRLVAPVLCIALCVGSCTYLYANRPSVKYQGHGFEYMNGYSSTDFEDYTVYAKNSKLVTLDKSPSFVIENEDDMPVLDGAEACYPLYSAFAKAVYKDIDKIEKGYIDDEEYQYENGKIVTFTNTINAFDRLINTYDEYLHNVDMFFGARPSKDQLQQAQDCGIEIEVTPIGKEAFVFFVEEDNPIDSLTSEQIRQIYHGDITNWNQLGGNNQKILAFQRPNNSGSQTMMTYFMGDMSLKEPQKFETVSAMEGIITQVAQYNNEAGAMGYTFRYFLEELNQEKGVKMLSIDGVYPTVESIENGAYPITVDLCLITRKDDPNPNVQRMKEFILSQDGQYIIHKTGYGSLK